MRHPNSELPAPNLIALFGPTGSGKSDLAEALADRTGAQLVNADAFQVYRGLDIGTNKSARRTEYKLIDIKEPNDSYGVGEFVMDASRILAKVFSEGRDAIIVGGTGLYIRALFEEYREMASSPDPALRKELSQLGLNELLSRLDAVSPGNRVDRLNRIRVQRTLERALGDRRPLEFALPPFKKVKLGVEVEPKLLAENLDSRVIKLLEAGWVSEVKSLLSKGVLEESPAFRAIGYKEISRYLRGEITFEGMVDLVQIQTRQYAKRQRAWMRSEPKMFLVKRAELGTPSVAEIEATLNRIKQISNQG
ncbi:MAG: tRNA (adenosine(37)-N6)-dimethylallyltransferase MiaA [Chthonomonas sp.]|nr:tRNA (adenosine(37)-N6)-dimethylallyltransferase MiaA [Chthonomonas sp.]